jgi:hypothetical protein
MQKERKELLVKIVLHVVIWAVLLGLPFYSARRISSDNDFLLVYYVFTIINALIFYSNYLFLVPKLFFQRKRFRYYISALALLVFFYLISDFTSNMVFGYLQDKNNERSMKSPDSNGMRQPPRQPPGGILAIRLPPGNAHIFGYMSSALFMVFLSLGLRVFERQNKIEQRQEELEKEKLNSELALLKNQISPHFFFNTLNNIYSLAGINAEDSQKAIHKLSKLMRYLLYESEHGNTMLSNEIEFMNNYIDLMKLRMSDKVSLEVNFPEQRGPLSIPPLLFIPFIENAFKHGISYRNNSFIKINLRVNKQQIEFSCSNSVNKADAAENGNSGIGLENVKKRLNLLFPGKHELKISTASGVFNILLNISLS